MAVPIARSARSQVNFHSNHKSRLWLVACALWLQLLLPAPASAQTLSKNSVFVPVTPCKVGDTRETGTHVAANSFVEWLAFGDDLSSQGGSADGCANPKSPQIPIAVAVTVNAIGTASSGNGNLQLYPAHAGPGGVTVVYSKGANIANSTIVELDPDTGAFRIESRQADLPAAAIVTRYFYAISGWSDAMLVDANGDMVGPIIEFRSGPVNILLPVTDVHGNSRSVRLAARASGFDWFEEDPEFAYFSDLNCEGVMWIQKSWFEGPRAQFEALSDLGYIFTPDPAYPNKQDLYLKIPDAPAQVVQPASWFAPAGGCSNYTSTFDIELVPYELAVEDTNSQFASSLNIAR